MGIPATRSVRNLASPLPFRPKSCQGQMALQGISTGAKRGLSEDVDARPHHAMGDEDLGMPTHVLRIVHRVQREHNVWSEAFTFSERMDYVRLIEGIERAKVLERKSMGGRGGLDEDVIERAHLAKCKSRNIVDSKIGTSGPTYR